MDRRRAQRGPAPAPADRVRDDERFRGEVARQIATLRGRGLLRVMDARLLLRTGEGKLTEVDLNPMLADPPPGGNPLAADLLGTNGGGNGGTHASGGLSQDGRFRARRPASPDRRDRARRARARAARRARLGVGPARERAPSRGPPRRAGVPDPGGSRCSLAPRSRCAPKRRPRSSWLRPHAARRSSTRSGRSRRATPPPRRRPARRRGGGRRARRPGVRPRDPGRRRGRRARHRRACSRPRWSRPRSPRRRTLLGNGGSTLLTGPDFGRGCWGRPCSRLPLMRGLVPAGDWAAELTPARVGGAPADVRRTMSMRGRWTSTPARRIVLLAGEGLKPTEIAARLGAIEIRSARGAGGSSSTAWMAWLDEPRPGARADHRRPGRGGIVKTLETKPEGRHALVHARDGRRGRAVADGGVADLARVRAAAAPHRDVQALDRSAVHREGPRRRRPLPRRRPSGRSCCASTRSPRSRPRSHRADPADAARQARAATHDYMRSGTSSLFAALDVDHRRGDRRAAPPPSRDRVPEVPATIDRDVPAELDVHLVLDNSSTHKTPAIQRWLAAHPRFVLHFTPDLSSLAEPRRALVRRAHDQEAAPRRAPLSVRHSTPTSAPGSRPGTTTPDLRLDQDRRPDPRPSIARYCERDHLRPLDNTTAISVTAARGPAPGSASSNTPSVSSSTTSTMCARARPRGTRGARAGGAGEPA